ncbi:MAG: HEAT repeat domain-containing protein, partial [Phycisphaeraceae bacterium]
MRTAVVGFITAAICLTLLSGCTPAVSEGGFNAPDPGSKLYAIIRAGQTRDRTAIPHLIEQLESDDQAVRMYSILALDRITGTRLGYIHHAPSHHRQAAVARWVEAYRTGELEDDHAKAPQP